MSVQILMSANSRQDLEVLTDAIVNQLSYDGYTLHSRAKIRRRTGDYLQEFHVGRQKGATL